MSAASNIHFKTPDLPSWMTEGEKFMKWDDVSFGHF